jgi:hypothetical protein
MDHFTRGRNAFIQWRVYRSFTWSRNVYDARETAHTVGELCKRMTPNPSNRSQHAPRYERRGELIL